MDETSGSLTARVVAVGRAVGVGGRRDEHVSALLPGADRLAVRAARGLGAGRTRRVLGWSGHPGLRMLAVDAAVEEALRRTRAGTVVVLGAGYDTRAWRLEALRGRTVIEVDHPATQRDKRRRLAAAGDPLADLAFVRADLAVADLGAVLATAGHAAGAPTVWLWEAVVPYLPADVVDHILAALAARSAPGSRLLMTTVRPTLLTPRPVGRALSGVARAGMAWLGEPVLLAESDQEVTARLARHGFAHRSVSGPSRWAADAGLQLLGPSLDERLHVAVREPGTPQDER